MISANSGQLITFDSPLLKDKISLFTLTYGKKMVMAFLLMAIISIAILVGLYHRDSLTFSGLPGDDKQAFGMAQMELYKKEKVNPLGGCLPMLLQIPFFIALYYVLIESVQLRHAPSVHKVGDQRCDKNRFARAA